MEYVKAHNVLPEEIIELIQEYIDGEYLYIPRKSENEKAWGEKMEQEIALRKEIMKFSKNILVELKFQNLQMNTFFQNKV